MPTLEATIILKQDGVDVPGFPITSRMSVLDIRSADESFGFGGGFVSFQSWPVVSVVAIQSSEQVLTLRLNGQSDAGILVNPGGVVVLFNVGLTDGLTTNVKIQNATTEFAQVKSVFGGRT